MKSNKIPPNVTLYGYVKNSEGWISVTVKMDSAGKIESVDTTEPANRMTAIENVKINLGRQFAVDDGTYK